MKNKVFPISMTVLWGMVFGSAMHSLTMGICRGLMMGIELRAYLARMIEREVKVKRNEL